jgi:hypothetical protein
MLRRHFFSGPKDKKHTAEQKKISIVESFIWAIQFVVTKFLATGSQVPSFAAITLGV